MSAPRRSFYFLTPLISVLLTLLLAELAFSVFAPVPFSLERNMYYESDPYTGYRHKPDAVGRYLNDVPAFANSRGQRDNEVAVPKPDGVFRIMTIGDSFTAGAGVSQDDAYPQVLERLLSTEEGRIEVVNTGTGGWAPFQYAQYVEHYAAAFEPDLLLLGFFVGNDSYVETFAIDDTLTAVLGRRVSRETGSSPFGAIKVFLYERSHIARLLLTQGTNRVVDFSRTSCDAFGDYFLGVQRTRMANHVARPTAGQFDTLLRNVSEVARIKQWADQRSIPLLVFVIPDENQINSELQSVMWQRLNPDDYDFGNPQALLKPLFALLAIDWFDLRPVFLSDPRCLYMSDSHWTAEGHALVAEVIDEALRTGGYLPVE